MTAARRRRSTTDQHLVARAAELSFASLRDYLADRAMTRGRPSTTIASELGVHPRRCGTGSTGTACPAAGDPAALSGIQRQTACWAAKRQARLASLGFADVEDYLRVRRVGQGWSLRRMLAQLRVGSAWLMDQMQRLGVP